MSLMEFISVSKTPEMFTALDATVLVALIVGVLILKGFALYKAARLKEKLWFWIILVLNTAGILPAAYLYMKRKKKV